MSEAINIPKSASGNFTSQNSHPRPLFFCLELDDVDDAITDISFIAYSGSYGF
ncbi:MAG: hypothetical protein HRF49_07180 [bacterium]